MIVATLSGCALFMFYGIGRVPIVLWDEARIAVNAMEMRRGGLGLVTTYGLVPDLWNTKPPLEVWLMTASMALFGATEWAIRLPSMLAAVGTLLLVVGFVRRLTHSTGTAILAAAILTASIGFFGEHGARTGDYEALLGFFTTAYLMLLFFAFHRARPPPRILLLAGAMAAGALMTKTVAGVVPGVGLVLHLLVTNRWRRPLVNPWYPMAAAAAIAPFLLFCIAREAVAPGYLAATISNDAGRFGATLEGHRQPLWYFVKAAFVDGLFSAGLFTLATPLALLAVRGRTRLALIFSLCVAAGQLAVVSASSTKIAHYYAPAYPFLAIAVALALRAAWQLAKTRSAVVALVAKLSVAALVVHGLVMAVYAREAFFPSIEYYPRARYGELLAALPPTRGPIFVLDRGMPIADDPHFTPQLQYYLLVAAEHGIRARRVTDVAILAAPPAGAILGSCDAYFVPMLKARGPNLVTVPGCVAIR